jgi:hypothetical protein
MLPYLYSDCRSVQQALQLGWVSLGSEKNGRQREAALRAATARDHGPHCFFQ